MCTLHMEQIASCLDGQITIDFDVTLRTRTRSISFSYFC